METWEVPSGSSTLITMFHRLFPARGWKHMLVRGRDEECGYMKMFHRLFPARGWKLSRTSSNGQSESRHVSSPIPRKGMETNCNFAQPVELAEQSFIAYSPQGDGNLSFQGRRRQASPHRLVSSPIPRKGMETAEGFYKERDE